MLGRSSPSRPDPFQWVGKVEAVDPVGITSKALYLLIYMIMTDYRCVKAKGFQSNAKQLFSSPLFNLNNNKYHRTLYIWTEYRNMAQIGTFKL